MTPGHLTGFELFIVFHLNGRLGVTLRGLRPTAAGVGSTERIPARPRNVRGTNRARVAKDRHRILQQSAYAQQLLPRPGRDPPL